MERGILEHPGAWVMKYMGCHHFQVQPQHFRWVFFDIFFLFGNVPGFIRHPRIAYVIYMSI